jgi:hypothetical protein
MSTMRPIRSVLTVPFAVIALAVSGCGSDSTIAPSEEDVRDYITALATSAGVDASFHSGFPPAEGSGPVINLGGSGAMITGGSAIRTVSSPTAFTRIIVAVDGVDGYWEITLPTAVTAEELVLTLAQSLPETTFNVDFALGGAGGVGNWGSEYVQVLIVGTGVVQVSVTWNTSADVDLYVVDAVGEEIYYGDQQAGSGGFLDLDSNAACSGDNIRNENITWPESAPAGTYTVRVNLWDDCDAPVTDYVVTVRRRDQAPLTFSGTLNAPGNFGAEGAGVVVTTFNY